MFKKTLLAASILGGASFAANAGQLSASVTETADQVTAFTAAAYTTCQAAADALGVDLDLNGNTYDATGNTVGTPTDGGVAGAYDQTANVVQLTDATTCTVDINSDMLVDASSVANSLEGAQADGLVVAATKIAGVGGYSAEDTIRIVVTGGTVNELESAGATLTSAVTSGGSEFELIGVLGNEILFTVSVAATAGTSFTPPTSGKVPFEIVTIAGLNVTPNDGVTEISLSAETQNTANVIYDQSPAAKVSELKKQYSSALVAGYDGIIDVSKDRLSLAVNANDAFNPTALLITPSTGAEAIDEDTAVLKVGVETSQGNLVPASADLVIKGDFAWMADLDVSASADDLPTFSELQDGVSYGVYTDATFLTNGDDTVSNIAINAEYNELTVTLAPGANADLDPYHTVGFVVPGDASGTTSLNVTDFEAGLVVKDTNDNEAEVLAADTKIGEWTLNGSVVTIPYMPFGPNTKAILRHTSTSTQVGDITVRYILEDLDPANGDNWVSVGEVETDVANGVLNITSQVMDAIIADAGVEKGKVAIEITTNVPAEDVTVYAAYNVKNSADDRGFVGTFGELGSAGVPVTP
jgi:hypothetical protein